MPYHLKYATVDLLMLIRILSERIWLKELMLKRTRCEIIYQKGDSFRNDNISMTYIKKSTTDPHLLNQSDWPIGRAILFIGRFLLY
jgi:hypothetical protein